MAQFTCGKHFIYRNRSNHMCKSKNCIASYSIILCLMIPGDPFPIPRGCVIGGLCAVVIWKLVQNKKCKTLTFFF